MTEPKPDTIKKAWVAATKTRVQDFIKAGFPVDKALELALNTQADILALEVRDLVLQEFARLQGTK